MSPDDAANRSARPREGDASSSGDSGAGRASAAPVRPGRAPLPQDDAESVAREWAADPNNAYLRDNPKSGTIDVGVNVASLAALLRQRDVNTYRLKEASSARALKERSEALCDAYDDIAELKAELEAARTERDEQEREIMEWSARVDAAEAQRDALAAQVAALRAKLWQVRNDEWAVSDRRGEPRFPDPFGMNGVLADTEAAAASLLAREREKEREACAAICEERTILNEAVEGAEDEATDPHTGVRATAADHRGMEARCCANEIRARSEP